DEEPPDDASLGPRLDRHQGFPEELLGCRPEVRGVPDELHATRLATSAGVDLRLHDAGEAEARSRGHRFLDGEAGLAVGHRHAVAPKDFLRLMLVYIHFGLRGPVRCSLAPLAALLRCPRPPSALADARASSGFARALMRARGVPGAAKPRPPNVVVDGP